ncbi:hypothetical protein OAR31_05850 [Candidatus Marinimicrobia bacterium]|nr:hypothetical protein [Candidatus Neomarinimicrobiota bacterium]
MKNQYNPIALTEEIQSIEENILREETPINQVEISFADAFKNARNEFGAGFTFIWQGNLYKTDRADDITEDANDTIQFVLDSAKQETTSAINIEIAP